MSSPQQPELRRLAGAFARETSRLLNGTVTDGIRISAFMEPEGTAVVGYRVAKNRLRGAPIPLARRSREGGGRPVRSQRARRHLKGICRRLAAPIGTRPMSLSLRLLTDRYVFESSPTRHDLGALHVSFDELTQPGQTEARLDAAVRRREPVALIGASGSGKSSVIAHMLGPLAEGVAPLFVPLASMPAETIDTPAHLADHPLSTITRLAD